MVMRLRTVTRSGERLLVFYEAGATVSDCRRSMRSSRHRFLKPPYSLTVLALRLSPTIACLDVGSKRRLTPSNMHDDNHTPNVRNCKMAVGNP